MRCSLLYLCLCLAVMMIAARAAAEDRPVAPEPGPTWYYDPWRTNDGLPNNDVTGVVQGSDGALVVGTLSGLARFDGLRFRKLDLPLPVESSDPIGGVCRGLNGSVWAIARKHALELKSGEETRSVPLPQIPDGSHLTAMFVTADGVLWISFDTGMLLRVDDGKATLAKADTGLAANFSTMAALDAKGTVWAAGPDALARWTGGKLVKVADLPPRKIALTAARDGGLWIGAGRRLLRYTEEKGVNQVAELDALNQRTRIATLLEDSSGRVWCGTFNGGLHCWSGKSFERVNVAHHDVWALSEDVEHNIWVGTGGNGMVRVRQRVLTPLAEAGGPVNQTPRSLCVDARQQVWVVTQTGDVFVREARGWRQIDISRDLHTFTATSVVADASGGVWIACIENKLSHWDGTTFRDEPLPGTGQASQRVFSMMVARDGSLWVGRSEQLLHHTAEGWKAFAPIADKEFITTLVQDRAGDVWVGTTRGHLLRVKGTGLAKEDGDGKETAIRCLMAAPDGALWIGRADKLQRLKAGRWSEITAEHGLTGGALSQLTLDDRGRVWLGVDQGVLLARLEDLNAAAEGVVDRIHFSRTSQVACRPARDSRRIPPSWEMAGCGSALATAW